MYYTKPALTFRDQANHLILRGLSADPVVLETALSRVNYYRLSAYWFPFCGKDQSFKPETTFKDIWDRYTFDRQLRLILIDAIERVEIALRTEIVNRHALIHGPFGYLDHETLPCISHEKHQEFLHILIRLKHHSNHEAFVQHFVNRYTNENHLPLWMACELMSFGQVFSFFKGLEVGHKMRSLQHLACRANSCLAG